MMEPHFRLPDLPVRTETVERWSPCGTPDLAMPSGERRSSRVEGLQAAAPGILEYGRVLPGQGRPSPTASSR